MAEYTIQLFDKQIHDRKNFSSGIVAMDRWFQNSISEQIKNNRLRVWCATNSGGELVGYYAINSHSVAPSQAPDIARKSERHAIPCAYLMALAVNKPFQGKGIGNALLANCIERVVNISEELGIAAILLDVEQDDKFEARAKFYETLGFQFFAGSDKRMFLTINDAKASVDG